NYLKHYQRRSRLKDLGETPNGESTRRRKRPLSVGLSVGEFTPQVDFCFECTFWSCPEYVSSVYKPLATDIRLITLKDSSRLDSPEVLLIEEKAGSFLGMVDTPLLGLAENDGSVNGTFQVHQQPSKTPKIPPVSVNMQCKSVTTADTRERHLTGF
ncbi:hypothetical protein TSMEX_005951, partial [Taenia solium]